ncbi:MAG: ribose 5-phosphate isomerase B [Chloroflexi bacterium]|nr:ribose 5-phosphate isomerase B [Chloroflexota bacterium]
MKIAIGGDHAGFELKQSIGDELREAGHDVLDVGAHEFSPGDDYPDFAKALGEAVAGGAAERGVLICGSGIGACIAANKIKGVRAALVADTYSAHQGVEHDDMNVLCLGSRVTGPALAAELVRAFLGATFKPEERFVRRLNKVLAIEADEAPFDGANTAPLRAG